jgi:2-beta-glucuronyltransferase
MTALARRDRATPASEPARRCVTIYSYHLYEQRRRGGMHFLCEAFRALGWNVRFITCDYSALTVLKGDRRTKFGTAVGFNRLTRIADDLEVAVIFTPFHAIGRARGALARIAGLATRGYPWPLAGRAAAFARGADLVVMESCGALMFADAIRAASAAPIVYRASDNLDVIRPVPALVRAEEKALGIVDAVSVASPHLAEKFAGGPVRFDPMGLDKAQFDKGAPSPYPPNGRKRVVISGSSSFDHDAARAAAAARPDWDFYQIGSLDAPVSEPNFYMLGERPFADVVGYVAHADIGFAPYLTRPGFEYQADHSNRLLQYVYCGLPSVVPEALAGATRPHFFGYRAGDAQSVAAAFERAAAFDRNAVPRGSVIDWTELAIRLSGIERRPACVSS